MDKGQIKIINKIEEFKFIIREWSYSRGKLGFLLNAGNKEITHRRFDALLIFYTSQDEYVEQGIYGSSKDVKIHRLNKKNFTQDFLNEMKSLGLIPKFKFFGGKYLIRKGNDWYFFSPTVSIKKSELTENYFIAIYYFDDGESKRNQELYVHGIWEVELSEEIKKSLNMEK
ncbi:MAG: hypothetical protein LBP34_00290 [Flavobacteriaceae bacterium]|jgi:hypothetical protein|nr:hypothetical protein [Flavobacteriaceae bacterium]